jgi:cytochrome c-type biogenesis protein CcmH/NrfG
LSQSATQITERKLALFLIESLFLLASLTLDYDHGVALARQQRYAEAADQFQEALQRKPDHSAAKSALERARQLAKGQRPAQP